MMHVYECINNVCHFDRRPVEGHFGRIAEEIVDSTTTDGEDNSDNQDYSDWDVDTFQEKYQERLKDLEIYI